MKKHVLSFLFFVFILSSSAQELVNDTITRTSSIKANIVGNSVILTPETPTLNQIAGAPKAFYTHYWEFGDGHYSTEKKPNHIYKNIGEYEVKLWATNHYDTGKPPTSRPKKIAISSITSEIERYMAMPGQALSYKIGQLKIRELRAKAEQELGANFDIREFHNQVLSVGCVPLALLEDNINTWIQENK